MKFTSTVVAGTPEILANDHYAGMPHEFEEDAKAGDFIANYGVALYDVKVAENPNGTVVIHGFIDASKLASEQIPSAEDMATMPMIKWIKANGDFADMVDDDDDVTGDDETGDGV